MSTVLINRTGVDQVTLDISQTGRDETSVTLRHDLLDENRTYHLSVTELKADLNKSPIFNYEDDYELFRVIRRNAGENLLVANNTAIVDPRAVYTLSKNKHFFNTFAFLDDIQGFARGFSEYITLAGILDFTPYGKVVNTEDAIYQYIPPLTQDQMNNIGSYDMFEFRVNSDNRCIIHGSSTFWNHFCNTAKSARSEIVWPNGQCDCGTGWILLLDMFASQ